MDGVDDNARRHPYQVFLAAFMILVGIPILWGGPQPNSLGALLPDWLVYVWATTIVLSGGLILLAAMVRSNLNALYLEGAAHLPLAISCAAYAVAVIGVAGGSGLAAATMVAGMTVAALFRTRQVFRGFRRIRRAISDAGGV